MGYGTGVQGCAREGKGAQESVRECERVQESASECKATCRSPPRSGGMGAGTSRGEPGESGCANASGIVDFGRPSRVHPAAYRRHPSSRGSLSRSRGSPERAGGGTLTSLARREARAAEGPSPRIGGPGARPRPAGLHPPIQEVSVRRPRSRRRLSALLVACLGPKAGLKASGVDSVAPPSAAAAAPPC
eukprot:scaffold36005_cov39-Phaeocystis_antarctica.AAC.3